ncbi:upf0481 protein [Quercus suber]|uniref:Upf0481 protein n=1 Tax=Quercus suber TaxID=58331 RepID=A0AAW0IJ67_QUESU
MKSAKTEIQRGAMRTIKECEESVRCCYAETIQLSSDHFVKIIIVDVIFILELFWRDYFSDWTSEDNGASIETWLMNAIRFDLILLENQLPFFILEKLFHHAFASHPSYSRSLIQVMTFNYFDYYNTQGISYSPHLKMKHFLDLLRTFWLPPSEKLPKRGNDVVKHLHSATELYEAGLAFYRKSIFPWHSWLEALQHDYFSSPCKVAWTITVIIFLVLTFLQTIYTMFPKK